MLKSDCPVYVEMLRQCTNPSMLQTEWTKPSLMLSQNPEDIAERPYWTRALNLHEMFALCKVCR